MFFQQNDSLDVKVSGMMISELLIILEVALSNPLTCLKFSYQQYYFGGYFTDV